MRFSLALAKLAFSSLRSFDIALSRLCFLVESVGASFFVDYRLVFVGY